MTYLNLPYTEICLALVMGSGLNFIYLYLLWCTIKILPRVKNKGMVLFFSGAVRLFLFLFFAVILSADHAGRFMWIVIGFVLTRLIFVNMAKNNIKKGHNK